MCMNSVFMSVCMHEYGWRKCTHLSCSLPSLFSPTLPLQVYLGRYKQTGQYYAIKVLQKKAIIRRNEVKHIMAERNVLLQNLQHPFLVGLHYSFQTSSKLYFVLDYVNGGELFFHLQRERVFDEPRARWGKEEKGEEEGGGREEGRGGGGREGGGRGEEGR